MQQLDLLDLIASRQPIPKTPRPEHKPYEPNTPYRESYFILQGAFLDWTRTFGRFSDFLSQDSPDPKLQKARDWKWESRTVKMPAYRWREFEENSAIYAAWISLFRKHLLGLTTKHFQALKWDRDPITEYIEERLEKLQTC